MKSRLAAVIVATIGLLSGTGQAGEIESLLCRINSGSPFKAHKIHVWDTSARLMPPREVESGKPVVQREAVIEKRFSFAADYDPERQEFVRVRNSRMSKREQGFPRSDLAGGVKLLLRGPCRSVEVFADSPNHHRDLRIWGTVTFDAEVAFERQTRRPVFYQRSSAFGGSADQAASLSREKILQIFEKRYKKLIQLPEDAHLDVAWMADYPLSPNELIPVAEIWYRRKDQAGKDYVLFQFNPASQELTLYERNWTDGEATNHGG